MQFQKLQLPFAERRLVVLVLACRRGMPCREGWRLAISRNCTPLLRVLQGCPWVLWRCSQCNCDVAACRRAAHARLVLGPTTHPALLCTCRSCHSTASDSTPLYPLPPHPAHPLLLSCPRSHQRHQGQQEARGCGRGLSRPVRTARGRFRPPVITPPAAASSIWCRPSCGFVRPLIERALSASAWAFWQLTRPSPLHV